MRPLDSIHVLRATAIILMIQVHFVENLSSPRGDSDWLYEASIILGSLAAPIFTFLVGLSLWLWTVKHGSLSNPGRAIARRGGTLIAIGLLFAVAIWGPEEIFNWDILPFIGASTLVLFPLRRLPIAVLALLAIVPLVLAPSLRESTGYAEHWTTGEYQYDFTVRDIGLGFLLHGYFPLLPWIAFPLVGLATGKICFPLGEAEPGRWHLPVAGGVLVLLSLTLIPGKFSFYPASAKFVLGVLGFILLAFWLLYRILDEKDMAYGAAMRFLRRYSAFSLSVYVIHHVVHVWPLYVAALAQEKSDIWYFYQSATDPPVALALACVFVLVFYPALGWWEGRRRWSLEGLLRRGTRT